MSIHSTGLGDDDKLVVRPARAAALLDIGIVKVYELINSGELESYKDGSARKVTMRSIKARMERLLAETKSDYSVRTAKATAASLASRGHAEIPSAA